jgi:hypothetical protein
MPHEARAAFTQPQAYRAIYEECGLEIVAEEHPLGGERDGLTWLSETTVAPAGSLRHKPESRTAESEHPNLAARACESKMNACEGASLKGEQFGGSNLPVPTNFRYCLLISITNPLLRRLSTQRRGWNAQT